MKAFPAFTIALLLAPVAALHAADDDSPMLRRVPEVNAPLAPGSADRILVKTGGEWLWEGKPVKPEELEK